jgi:hypothetical protein
MTIPCKRVVTVSVLILLACAAARAATRRYQEREEAFRKECQTEREKSGLSATDLRAKYPTPEIRMVSPVCVLAGATADVVVTGRFAAGAKFFVENDNFEVIKESVTENQYRATLKAMAGIGPETATLAMINPVTAQTARIANAVRVGGRYEWTMAAANGWKVVARSQATDRCAPEPAASQYDLSFARPGENAAFEKITGRLGFLPSNQRNYRFDLSSEAPAPAGMEAYQALMQKMADPKLSAAERDRIMAKLADAQKEMTAALTKLADPAYAKQQAQEQQRREQEFGCRWLEITAEGGKVTGEMSCSEKVGRRLALTGTVAPVK